MRSIAAALALVVSVPAVTGGAAAAGAEIDRTALIAYGNPITVVDARGDLRWQGPSGFSPTWSPDGEQLSFGTDGGLLVADITNGAVHPVEGFQGATTFSDWSADGSRIAFAGAAGGAGRRELFVAPVGACCAVQVTSLSAEGFSVQALRWTADSQRVVVAADDGAGVGGELLASTSIPVP